MKDVERRARELLEAYLRGWTEGGHPPLTLGEIREAYQAALAQATRTDPPPSPSGA